MIHRLVERFRKQGSICDLPRAGIRHSSMIPENAEYIQGSIEEFAGTSTRRQSAELNMGRTTLQRILHNLHFFPYKIQLVHELKHTDYQERLDYAVRIQKLAKEETGFIDSLIMFDEEHFHLDGFINKKNYRIWSRES